MVMIDRRLSIRWVAEVTGISYGSVESVLTNILCLQKLSARCVPRMFAPDEKQFRTVHSEVNLVKFIAHPDGFLARFIIVDTTWVHHFDPKSKKQITEWHKVMIKIFWDAEGILMADYL